MCALVVLTSGRAEKEGGGASGEETLSHGATQRERDRQNERKRPCYTFGVSSDTD